MNRMDAVIPEINFGTSICEKLKNIYFSEKPWNECYKEVAKKFTELKIHARKFYFDKNDIEILSELLKYGQDDIKEMFHIEHGSHNNES